MGDAYTFSETTAPAEDTCCEARTGMCSKNTGGTGDFSCPTDFQLKPNPETITGDTKEKCCDAVPEVLGTCMNFEKKGEKFKCPDGWTHIDRELNVKVGVTFRAKSKCHTERKCVSEVKADRKCPAACLNTPAGGGGTDGGSDGKTSSLGRRCIEKPAIVILALVLGSFYRN